MASDKFIQNKGNKRILVISGAGLSVESGMEPFRLDDGLWDNININDVCNIATLSTKYHVIHTFYNTLRAKLKDCEPNDMHHYIKGLEDTYGDNFLHMTSNIDDLYTRIGGTELKLHGNLKEIVEDYTTGGNDYRVIDVGYEPYIPKESVFAKPNVVFTGEFYRYVDGIRLPIYDERNDVLRSLTENDIVIVIGSSDTILKWSKMAACLAAFSININIRKNDTDFLFNQTIIKPCTKAIPVLDSIIKEKMK